MYNAQWFSKEPKFNDKYKSKIKIGDVYLKGNSQPKNLWIKKIKLKTAFSKEESYIAIYFFVDLPEVLTNKEDCEKVDEARWKYKESNYNFRTIRKYQYCQKEDFFSLYKFNKSLQSLKPVFDVQIKKDIDSTLKELEILGGL